MSRVPQGDRYMTLLVVPHDEGSVRRLRVSYRRLKVLAAGGLVMGGLAAAGLLAYGRMGARAFQADRLERENARLATENAAVDEIVDNLERSERAYRQIRALAGLGEAGEEVLAGIGHPAPETALASPSGGSGPPAGGWPLSIRGVQTAAFEGPDGHSGIDIAAPTNTPVLATAAGIVKQTGYDRVLGHFVVVQHARGLETMYAHNAHLLVKRGESVERDETIAYSGNSGRSSAPHLHYEVRRAGLPVDPRPYLP